MQQEFMNFKTGLLGSGAGQFIFNRFTGPGRLAMQSAYFTPEPTGSVSSGGGFGFGGGDRDGGGGLLGGIMGGLLDN
jgi:hypothetical protein